MTNPNQERIARLRKLEAEFDARPSATMDCNLDKRAELLAKIRELRQMIPQTIYDGKPSPMMNAQNNWKVLE